MANANSMGGLCISFDTECRNSLSLKSLKRALDNELVYDIKKTNVEYYDIKKAVENVINNNYFYNNRDEKFVLDENEENISIDTYGDWIVSLLEEEDEKLITVINKNTGYFYSGSSIVNSSGQDYRVRGSVPLRGCGELYKEAGNYNEDNNKIGGWIKVPATTPEEYNYAYIDIIQAEALKRTRIYVILSGENKGKSSESLEELAAL